jgi:hypothetical protein
MSWYGTLHGHRDLHHPLRVRERLAEHDLLRIGGHLRDRGVGEVEERRGVAQHALGLQLAHQRAQELLLVRDAPEVRSVADAVTDAQELQRLDALQRVLALGQVEPGVAVADVVGDADVDATDGVRHRDDAVHRVAAANWMSTPVSFSMVATVQDRPPYMYDALSIWPLIAEYCVPSGPVHEGSARSCRAGTTRPSRGAARRRCARAS